MEGGQLLDQLLNPRLAHLEHLSIAGSPSIQDNTVTQVVEALSRLRTLDLSETDISGVGVKQALQATHLEHLVVNHCRHIGIDAIDWARSRGVRVDHRMSDDPPGGRKVRY